MSELDGTASTKVSVVADGCSITLDAYMHDTVEIRAKFNPAYTIHFDHGLTPADGVYCACHHRSRNFHGHAKHVSGFVLAMVEADARIAAANNNSHR